MLGMSGVILYEHKAARKENSGVAHIGRRIGLYACNDIGLTAEEIESKAYCH